MPDELLLQLLEKTKEEIEKTLNLSSEEIEREAFAFFKKEKKKFINIFIDNKTDKKKAIFTAGASGAGKSEFVRSINKNLNYNVIDTDEIRKIFPFYTGVNAHLFQKPSIKAVEFLLDNIFKNNLAFILDTNLANFSVADKNIQRALKRGYEVEIYFIYRDYKACKELTTIREQNEGRRVNDEVFKSKAIGSLNSFKEIAKSYKDKIRLVILDLDENATYKDNFESHIIRYEQNLKIFLGDKQWKQIF